MALASTAVAVACGWIVDHYRLSTALQKKFTDAEQRETELLNAAHARAMAAETWRLAEAYNDESADEFEEILVRKHLVNLWLLCSNEATINSYDAVRADRWAYGILSALGCDDVDDIFEIARTLDRYDDIPYGAYITGNSSNDKLRRFVERAFASNSKQY